MKSIYIICFTIILFLLGNCKKEPDKNAVVSIDVDIAYKDKSGNDLLDTTKLTHYSSDSILVFTVVNGVKKEVYSSNLEFTRNFFIYRNDSLATFYLRLFLETDTTLLQLNKSTIDTIVSISEKSNGNWLLKKVWYNGALEWDNIAVPQAFTIVK